MKRKRKKKEGGKKVICVHRERSPHCKMKKRKKKQVKREWKGCTKENTVESESCPSKSQGKKSWESEVVESQFKCTFESYTRAHTHKCAFQTYI